MDLALAADYLHILPLLSRVCSALRDIMRAHPHIACDILQTFSDVPSSPQFSRLLDAAVSAIRQRPAHALLVDDMESGFTRPVCGTSGVLCLQENTLRRLLNDNDLFTSECYLFQVLFCWASCGYSLSLMSNKAGARRIEGADIFYAPGNVTGAEWDNVRNSERWNAGKRLLKCIDLERLKPSFIRDFVRRSGLASVELLCTTFENQALEAERGRALYDNLRGGSTWPHGGKTLCATTGGSVGKNYTLRAPWLQNGRHEWMFRIVKLATCFWLGFATTVPTIGPVYTHGSAAWAISGDGRAIEPHQEGGKGTITGPRLKEGKTVRLVLNLIKSGTVTVMVEGDSRTYGMFRELLSRGSSFCLVACLNAPGCIELIGEQHLLST